MQPQLQLWMPAVLSLFGTLIVVVLTAWLNTRMLSAQIDAVQAQIMALDSKIESVRTELRAEFRGEISTLRAELKLEFHQYFSQLNQRLERLEEQRGLVRQ